MINELRNIQLIKTSTAFRGAVGISDSQTQESEISLENRYSKAGCSVEEWKKCEVPFWENRSLLNPDKQESLANQMIAWLNSIDRE